MKVINAGNVGSKERVVDSGKHKPVKKIAAGDIEELVRVRDLYRLYVSRLSPRSGQANRAFAKAAKMTRFINKLIKRWDREVELCENKAQ